MSAPHDHIGRNTVAPGLTGSAFGTILRINARLAFASALALLGWATWPASLDWVAFGFFSVFAWMAAFGLTVKSLRDMAALHARDKAIAALQAQGAVAKSDRLASDDALAGKGMVAGRMRGRR